MTATLDFKITKTQASRLSQVDFDNLPFGTIFSDHMFTADYQQGKWQNPQIIPFGDLSLSPATSALHYGQAFFEGMKGFRQVNGKVAVFRPWKNHARFNKSANRMCMPTIPEELFLESLKELINLDRDWVPHNDNQSLYIRPVMFATEPHLGVHPSESYKYILMTCPIGAYFNKNLKVKIETRYARSCEGGVGFAKNAGNYAASLYPTTIAQQEGFDQLIWTDAKEHAYIEETGASNVMFLINNVLITPNTKETILDGVTRDSVLQLARSWGIEVQERPIPVKEIIDSLQTGKLQEAYGVGTAAIIAPISEIGYKENLYQLADPATWTLSKKITQTLNDMRKGLSHDIFSWNFII